MQCIHLSIVFGWRETRIQCDCVLTLSTQNHQHFVQCNRTPFYRSTVKRESDTIKHNKKTLSHRNSSTYTPKFIQHKPIHTRFHDYVMNAFVALAKFCWPNNCHSENESKYFARKTFNRFKCFHVLLLYWICTQSSRGTLLLWLHFCIRRKRQISE